MIYTSITLALKELRLKICVFFQLPITPTTCYMIIKKMQINAIKQKQVNTYEMVRSAVSNFLQQNLRIWLRWKQSLNHSDGIWFTPFQNSSRNIFKMNSFAFAIVCFCCLTLCHAAFPRFIYFRSQIPLPCQTIDDQHNLLRYAVEAI